MKSNVTKAMLKALRKIAREGKGSMHGKRDRYGKPMWLGFDDADVQWFLTDHQNKDGPAIRRLRQDYKHAYEIAIKRPLVLTFFSFTKPQAVALLRDVR